MPVRGSSASRENHRDVPPSAKAEGSALPPRLGRLLPLLLDGHSEKEIAAHLGLSRHTVHEYVKQIYKHTGVHSRAQLMARLLRR